MMILKPVLALCLFAIAISMLLCLYRLIIGPSMVDRLLALDTLLLVAMLGFVSTAALARYFTTGHVID